MSVWNDSWRETRTPIIQPLLACYLKTLNHRPNKSRKFVSGNLNRAAALPQGLKNPLEVASEDEMPYLHPAPVLALIQDGNLMYFCNIAASLRT